jgi:hypothetical protein
MVGITAILAQKSSMRKFFRFVFDGKWRSWSSTRQYLVLDRELKAGDTIVAARGLMGYGRLKRGIAFQVIPFVGPVMFTQTRGEKPTSSRA